MERPQGVEHQLRVALGIDENALAVLQVDDLQLRFGDDQAVSGAEPARHDVGEVETLLDQHLRITTGFPRDRDVFLDEGDVVVGQVFHLGIDPVGFRFEGRCLVEGAPQFPLCEGVCCGALFGSRRRGIRLA